MDPLSFTVAATQLLGAINSVILIVTRYNEEMKKTPRDLLRFFEELRGLRHVLESLESLVLKAKSLKADISTDSIIQDLFPLYEPLTLYVTADFRQELHRWLIAPDPTINHQAALKKRSDATGAWLAEIKLFAEWMENPRSFIWLYGIPGCGKTILTTTAIEHATKVSKQVLGRATAYFYVDFNEKEK
ncbi:hypothetical protein CORC01_04493 [Colletotrichum orchidophilum]|uniref:Nephrocystin 3-like N-terminal domain-containing protein n=1 Tax=Colletotrichum orchidophilum TaxID=1209926 RepID=A0A1G4BFY5_9PEZI|nr:uncharacterized protein CORC01_04493 [Colletotrichum orchidophilum]OHF00304.1 hypothetical protein CORC01_04493 [Colletotrichum orchidophilum]